MTPRHYCTYFDHRYLARGLALRESLAKHAPGSQLWVLCLSQECESMLRSMALSDVRLVPLAELEAADPQLAASRANRSLVEYYFTCSPCLPRYLLAENPEIAAITYLDSDVFFFSSPEAVFAEIGSAAIAITPHRFPAGRAQTMERYGRYNVGWLTFQRGDAAAACLEWWRERCIEWCHDRLEGDRFADQKYLDRFEALFDSVHVIRNPGVNLAPWNLDNHQIAGPPVAVDGTPLVFFHFHGLKQIAPRWFDTHLDSYKIRLQAPVRDLVYAPYLACLVAAEEMAARVAAVGRNEYLRAPTAAMAGWRGRIRRALLSIRSAMHGNLIRLR
jgi:hypothetical protein